ncbi:unnamed protein product [Closterium sp. NIES-54]
MVVADRISFLLKVSATSKREDQVRADDNGLMATPEIHAQPAANAGREGLVGAPACGDVMKLQIKVDENGKIVDSCFKTFGCGSAIASSSVATEWVKGKSVDEVMTIKNSDIAKHLSLPPVKLHCSMLAEDAIKAAVKDLQDKRGVAGEDVSAGAAAAVQAA